MSSTLYCIGGKYSLTVYFMGQVQLSYPLLHGGQVQLNYKLLRQVQLSYPLLHLGQVQLNYPRLGTNIAQLPSTA